MAWLSCAALLVAVPAVALLAGAQSEIVRVSRSGRGAYEASLAPHAGGFVVAWHDTRHGRPEIYARRVDAGGRPLADEHRLTRSTARSYEPGIAVAARDGADDFIVAWYDVAADDSSSVARVGAWTGAGVPRWERRLSAAGRRGRAAVVAVAGDRIQCAWIEEAPDASGAGDVGKHAAPPSRVEERERHGSPAGVWGQQFTLDGEPVGPPRRLAAASRTTWNLNLVMAGDGVAWVVFDARTGTRAHELFLARVDGDRVTVDRLSADDGADSVYPDLALGGGRAALAWWDTRDGNADVYLAIVQRDRLPDGIAAAASRVTATAGESIGAYVAWNGARFGLAWSDEVEPGRPEEVYFQKFTAGGVPGGAPRRLTDNPTASLIPAIHEAGARFALAWNEDVVEARGDHRAGGRSEVVFALVP